VALRDDSLIRRGSRQSTSYALFYPRLLQVQGRQAVADLRNAAQAEERVYKQDRHRLDALPAVAAAHLLRTTPLEDDRDALCSEIVNSLRNPDREVREIILQNLTTAICPTPDTETCFAVNQPVLAAIRNILQEAEANERLLTPAAQCVEFLLNAGAVLRARHSDMGPYDQILGVVMDSQAPHFWYLRRLIELHKATFTFHANKFDSIPPQSSEALMGWSTLVTVSPMRDYLSHLALIRVRLLHMLLAIKEGSMRADEVVTTNQAERAIPKLTAFYRDFHIGELLATTKVLDKSPTSDKAFKTFIRSGRFGEAIKDSDQLPLSTQNAQASSDEVRLGECVPFAQYCDHGLLQRMGEGNSEVHRRWLYKVIVNGIRSAAVGVPVATLVGYLCDFVERAFCLREGQPHQLSEKALTEAIDKIERVEQAVKAGEYKGVEEQQRELGDVPFPTPDK